MRCAGITTNNWLDRVLYLRDGSVFLVHGSPVRRILAKAQVFSLSDSSTRMDRNVDFIRLRDLSVATARLLSFGVALDSGAGVLHAGTKNLSCIREQFQS